MFDTTMFSVMDTLFPIVFLVILGVFVFILVQNVRTWNRNKQAPKKKEPSKERHKKKEPKKKYPDKPILHFSLFVFPLRSGSSPW